MDVGHLFQFQRPFHGDGVVDGTAQVENVAGFDEAVCHVGHVVLFFQHLFNLLGQVPKAVGNLMNQFCGNGASELCHVEGQQEECHQLGGVSLGGCHGDFRASQGVYHVVRFTGNGGADGVGNGQTLGAMFLGFLQGFQGINGFTGLADHDAEGVAGGERFAVAVFGSDFHGHRNLYKPFDIVLCHQACMVGGAAGSDEDIVNVIEAFFSPVQVRECNGAVLVQVNLHGVSDCFGLFEDFLQHEMGITALFCCFRRPCDLLDFLPDRLSVFIINGYAVLLHHCQFFIIQNVDIPGVVDDCGNIGGNEVFTFAQTDNEGIVLLGADNGVRVGAVHDNKAVGAFDDGKHLADGGEEIAVVQFFQQMGYDFRIRFGLEHMALFHEVFFQSQVVFNDTIMNHYEMVMAVSMGMGIPVGRFAMGCPAGMTDADMALERMLFQLIFQIHQPALLFLNVYFSIFIDRNACRIISSVFQAAKSVNQKVGGISTAHITYNTAHKWYSSLYLFLIISIGKIVIR